jgi:DNA polymerase-3 subunit alpha
VKLISEAHMRGKYYGRPRIDRDLLVRYHEGLHCSSACLAGEIARAIVAGRMDVARQTAKWHKELFGDNYSLEVMEHDSTAHPEMNANVLARQRLVTRGVFALAKELDIRVIATNDVHFLNAEDNDSHDVLLCISTGKKLSDPMKFTEDDKNGRMVYTGEEWFKSGEDMLKIFGEHLLLFFGDKGLRVCAALFLVLMADAYLARIRDAVQAEDLDRRCRTSLVDLFALIVTLTD